MFGRKNNIKKVECIPSIPLSRCFAKTTIENGKICLGDTVLHHCVVVGVMAEMLVDAYPQWFRKSLIPTHAGLFCSLHDIGKVSPTFQEKIRKACSDKDLEGFLNSDEDEDKGVGFHYSVTYDHFNKNYHQLAFDLGRHHGTNVTVMHEEGSECLGGKPWNLLRNDLVCELEKIFQSHVNEIRIPDDDVASGLVTFADWLGSDERFLFRNCDSLEKIRKQATEVIRTIKFKAPPLQDGLTFTQIFRFSPRPLQQQFIQGIEQGGVYILEAPMGVGKTEAALGGVGKLLETGQTTGLYFALPTQVTANQIYQRVEQFLKAVFKSSENEIVHLSLIHGMAKLHLEQEDIDVGGNWYRTNKKAILSPYGVGTVDQALMAVLAVRHNYLRAFGLAGKTVVFDEVHSYDAYTSTLISELVFRLRTLKCTVILLSATLTTELKRSLLHLPSLPSSPQTYPSMTILADGKYSVVPLPKPIDRTLYLEWQDDGIDAALNAAYDGQQVLWIENTIQEAQNVYKILAARGGETLEVGLLHAAFTASDRSSLENHWLQIYGKQGKQERLRKGRILIGTQVLEQSLDIDADLLISRMCPTDLLLQRAGRLWRHRENDSLRSASATPKLIVLPCVKETPLGHFSFLGLSKCVYARYILCRTYQLLGNRSSFVFPGDIATLVEATYEKREETGQLLEFEYELVKKRETLRACALAVSSDTSSPSNIDDEQISTRYEDRPRGRLLLIKKQREENGKLRIIFFNDEVKDLVPNDLDWKDRKDISRLIESNSLSVDAKLLSFDDARLSSFFEPYTYIGSGKPCKFSVAVVGKDTAVTLISTNKRIGWYTSDMGFVGAEE